MSNLAPVSRFFPCFDAWVLAAGFRFLPNFWTLPKTSQFAVATLTREGIAICLALPLLILLVTAIKNTIK